MVGVSPGMGAWAGSLLALAAFAQDVEGPVQPVKVNGAELAYVEQGRGTGGRAGARRRGRLSGLVARGAGRVAGSWNGCGVARRVDAQFINPKIFAEKVAAADRVVSL